MSARYPNFPQLCRWVALVFALVVAPCVRASAPDPASSTSVWQYSVPLEAGTERRAYLWIPVDCKHVRAVFFGLQNMMERNLFEDPEIRSTAASLDMAIVLVSPGAWPDKAIPTNPSLDVKTPQEAIDGTQAVLTALAQESGYSEIQYAPLAVTGHSAASPFIWMLARAWPQRVFAFLPFKGYHVDAIADDVPTLKGEQEWGEWGETWGDVWRADQEQAVSRIAQAKHPLFGDFTDLGSGHFDWHHDAASIISLFLRKAAATRLPPDAPPTGPVRLKAITAAAGVLVDPAQLGTPQFEAVAYQRFKGDRSRALWYFDREMAEAINQFMLSRLSTKPEAIDFVVDGRPVDLSKNGFAALKPEFLPDGVQFRVHAEALSASPTPHLFGGQSPLGHSSQPIVYRVSSGALEQTGPDTFKVSARSGGLTRQGQPWEPWIMAYEPGDSVYRSADRPAHILIDVRNKKGEPQSLDFAKLPEVNSGTQTIQLQGKASSGLPVQFYVESGPAVVEGNTLRLLPIPPRSRYPVRVLVSAYQWGRAGDHPIQSSGPVTQEIMFPVDGGLVRR
jgi:hypothetical protein